MLGDVTQQDLCADGDDLRGVTWKDLLLKRRPCRRQAAGREQIGSDPGRIRGLHPHPGLVRQGLLHQGLHVQGGLRLHIFSGGRVAGWRGVNTVQQSS